MARFALLAPPGSPDARLRAVRAGILLTLLLLPLWRRFPVRAGPPLFLPDLHVAYFVILLPVLATIGLWLLAGLPGLAALRRDPLRRAWALAALALALWALASNAWAFMALRDPETALNASVQLALALLFALVCACAGPSPRAVIATLAAGLLAHSLISIVQAAVQAPLGLTLLGEFPYDITARGASVLVAGDWRWLRPSGLMPHPNLLAGTLLVGLPAAAALLFAERRAFRALGLLALPLGLAALLLTFSRAAWLGLAAGAFGVLPLLWPLVRAPRAGRRVLAALALCVVVAVAFALAFRPLLLARAGVGQESVELRSVADRVVFASFAGRSIDERMLLGVGAGNFPWRTSYYLLETDFDLRGDNVHHVFLSAWAELGLVGLALLLLGLGLGLEGALRVLRAARAAPDRAARVALLAVVLALVAVGLLDHYPWTTFHFQLAWWGCLALAARPG